MDKPSQLQQPPLQAIVTPSPLATSQPIPQQIQPPHHPSHPLFELNPSDVRDDLDERTQRTYQLIKQIIVGKSPKEGDELIKSFASTPTPPTDPSNSSTTGQTAHTNVEDLILGLLVAILVETDESRYYRDIVSISRDGPVSLSTYLNMIIIEKLPKLKEHSVRQVFWLINQLIKSTTSSAENLCFSLMRQLAGGDLSPRNLWLIENFLDVLIDNRSWLTCSTTFMVPPTIYTYMRLVADHMGPAQAALRQKEVDFVIGLVREQFSDCLVIGRDFLRLLYNINRIPEFERLWHDIFNNPKSLHPTFHSPLQLLTTRTPRRLILSRLTFDMERKLSYLATQVKFGNQKRYQDSFHKQYLSAPESLSLRCDLIRYICSLIHPTNEVLCSDIIPRWAIIGWLLATCTTSVSATNSKIALFYDWLVYDPKVENIMNIEPAILVMFYSLRSHPNVTASLLDFLCRLPLIFLPKLSDNLRLGIKKALQHILEKRVIQSLTPLFDNPKHDPALKALIKENFPDYFTPAPQTTQVDNGISTQPVSAPSNQIGQQTNACVPPTAIKQLEVTILDNDNKINPQSELSNLNQETAPGNKVTSNQDNEITPTNRTGDSTSIHNDDVVDLNASSSALRDEVKPNWNGIEHVNTPSSNRPSNHDNKNKKLSVNNPGPNSESPKWPKKSLNQIDESSDPECIPKTVDIDEDTSDVFKEGKSSLRVVYPFMNVQSIDLKRTISTFDDQIRIVLEDLSNER